MDWKNPTSQAIDRAITAAERRGRSISVSPAWLRRVKVSLQALARLASRRPPKNIVAVIDAEMERDHVLAGEWPGARKARPKENRGRTRTADRGEPKGTR